jgi:DNA-binding transcriptional MerR regulator
MRLKARLKVSILIEKLRSYAMEEIEIKKIVAQKLSEGISLSDIQKQLSDEHDVKMTFLDLRLLASELENVDWESFNKEEETPEETDELDEAVDSPGEDTMHEDGDYQAADEALDAPSGGTVVELSKLARPGAVASGSVKFGSGASAEWILDQMGRLALSNASGEPTQDDIQEFQMELQKALTGGGV